MGATYATPTNLYFYKGQILRVTFGVTRKAQVQNIETDERGAKILTLRFIDSGHVIREKVITTVDGDKLAKGQALSLA